MVGAGCNPCTSSAWWRRRLRCRWRVAVAGGEAAARNRGLAWRIAGRSAGSRWRRRPRWCPGRMGRQLWGRRRRGGTAAAERRTGAFARTLRRSALLSQPCSSALPCRYSSRLISPQASRSHKASWASCRPGSPSARIWRDPARCRLLKTFAITASLVTARTTPSRLHRVISTQGYADPVVAIIPPTTSHLLTRPRPIWRFRARVSGLCRLVQGLRVRRRQRRMSPGTMTKTPQSGAPAASTAQVGVSSSAGSPLTHGEIGPVCVMPMAPDWDQGSSGEAYASTPEQLLRCEL